MTFEELIAAFGAKIGVALVADNESCVVGVDDMTVTFLHLDEADKISIYGEIGETPQDGIEELLSTMLEANHLFAETASIIQRSLPTSLRGSARKQSMIIKKPADS